MKLLGQLLGAAIGAAILWLSMPVFIFVLSLVGAFFELYLVFIIVMFPVFIVLYIGNEVYKSRQRDKARG